MLSTRLVVRAALVLVVTAVPVAAATVAAPAPPSAAGPIQSVRGYSGTVKLNERTIVMLDRARAYLASHGGCDPGHATPRNVVQGSYNAGGVAASAGTHDGGGVIDLHVLDLSTSARHALVRALRNVGFAAWLRHPPSFPYHIHAVAVGDPSLSPAARSQVTSYFNGRNGLANNGPDEDGGPVVLSWMKGAPAPSSGGSGGHPTLTLGARGPAVATLQTLLKRAGLDPGPVDGYFGPVTLGVVKAFQSKHGLLADGVVGPHTWAKLTAAPSAPSSGGGGAPSPAPSHPTLRRGSQGAAVKTLQSDLIAKGFKPGPVDGDFGPVTDAAVRAFQKSRKLPVDGVVGPITWRALE